MSENPTHSSAPDMPADEPGAQETGIVEIDLLPLIGRFQETVAEVAEPHKQDQLGPWKGLEAHAVIFDEVQFEDDPAAETLNFNFAEPTKASYSFELMPSRELANLAFGFDICALTETIAEWAKRPPRPFPPIKNAWTITENAWAIIETQDHVNRTRRNYQQAATRHAMEGGKP